MVSRCRSITAYAGLLTGLGSLAMPGVAVAANCSSSGGLAYLGNTKGATSSVWLSGTSAGSFGLEAAQGNQTVDTWTKSRRGLHLSLSPVVSNGNGGTHKLYDLSGGKPCLLDTQNQVRDGLFPDINWPDGRPDVGPQPVLPDLSLPDGRPDVGPQPVFPDFSLPDGRPDVGPQPVFPDFSLPDGRPDVGPQPVFPDFSLPDGRPDVGPQPVFPDFSLPDGRPDVRPQPIYPGFNPRTPTAVRGGRVIAGRTPDTCIDPRSVNSKQQRDLPICRDLAAKDAAARSGGGSSQVPLTPGRDLPAPSLWNFWSDIQFADISDNRYDRDSDTLARSLTMGLDRRITSDLVVGMTVALEDSSTDAFDGTLGIDTDGFSFGPYAAYRLSKHWAIDGSLTYGRYDNDIDLSVLSGEQDSERLAGEISLHGQYKVDAYLIRPKVSVSWSHINSDDYDLSGNILNIPVSVSLPGDSYNYGVLDLSTEISRYFRLPDGQPFLVFTELGAEYQFERPNDGKILTGDLSEVTPSPWSFSLRSGFRMLVNDNLQLEATGGYLSFGQKDLDVWEGKLHVSWSF
ncbi:MULTISPECIES: autotransporter outer membrane beta-barrel domain-containing protein [unclassified Ensifer]|uniref:autotransporter outer membrane beta-barrel domain-containing protein n=1 Tax=unclassified Ensifer TaxID=2633371 RepID=UPI000813D20B|nr:MULTISPECIES: autotransporter outer membrane beta-barrel domain-containing protein [unclassified Ensifer]OCP01782.1 autotransporter outer membrane beta-barrel domain-containing protein [Ensifer sp. LC14]OCP09571.1 autotransporter outer membrane beta-barrel domain-containing protein [Ensifer sp. LC13]OCP10744.1 autotransporter outer membrane beta-barrel domain-containing protein [Ensifer sp. LC11]OCP32818.1 autotransporter outer membrane beta-barrel domain-containing protein [Ensifer sp. LC49